jgi:hypothetical protein
MRNKPSIDGAGRARELAGYRLTRSAATAHELSKAIEKAEESRN